MKSYLTPEWATRFSTVINRLAVTFKETLDPVQVDAYAEALHGYPIEALEAGARRIIAESKFFPKPCEWRDAALDEAKSAAESARDQQKALAQDIESIPWEERRVEVRAMLDGLAGKLGWNRAAADSENVIPLRRRAAEGG